MPDLKYGRIFTEEDVHKIVEAVLENGDVQGPEDTKNIIEAIGDDLKFRGDEPVFVFRGQDAFAYGVVDEYRFAIQSGEAGVNGPTGPASQEVQDQVQTAVDLFADYARSHPELVKTPD